MIPFFASEKTKAHTSFEPKTLPKNPKAQKRIV